MAMKKERSEAVIVADRYRIAFDEPLAWLDSRGAQAFAAYETPVRAQLLYALVGRGLLPRRENVLARLIESPVPNVVRPLADSIIAQPSGQPAWAVVLERPDGGSLLSHARVEPFTEDALRRAVLPQMILILEQLRAGGMVHRSLRPDRLFWKTVEQATLVAGECFSEPPAYGQPPIYEPAERAAAVPSGRGEGVAACDLYALGVTLAALLLGRDDPCGRGAEGSGGALLDRRLARGSAALILAEVRVSGEFRALLHGLLDDDPGRRWSMVDLRLWLKGGQPAARRGVREAPSRPVTFADEHYMNRQLLAGALARAGDGADGFVRSPSFLNWVQNGLNDPESARLIRAALTGGASRLAQGGGPAAAVQRILDPAAPLRLGGQAIAVDGLGPALAEAFHADARDHLTAIAAGLQSGLIVDVAAGLGDTVADADLLRRRIAYLQSMTVRAAPGQGLERVLYELNPGLACHSPLLGGRYVARVADLVVALDAKAAVGGVASLVDRHVAAFLAARETALSGYLGALEGSLSDNARLSAELALFAALQRASGIPVLKGLTAFFTQRCRQVAERFHGARNRAAAQRLLDRLAGSGDLALLAAEIDLDGWEREDATGFQEARAQFGRNETAIQALAGPVAPQDAPARRLGHTGAVFVAYGVLMISALAALAVI